MVQEVNSRRLDIDLVRFIAAVCIVLGHCFLMYLDPACQIYDLFSEAPAIYRAVDPFAIYWALPAFVSISGYLAMCNSSLSDSSFNYLSFVKKKVLRLYIPGVAFSCFYLILFSRDLAWTDTLRKIFFDGAGHIWFLFMLFYIYLSAPIIKWGVQKMGWRTVLPITFIVSFISCFFPKNSSVLAVFFYYFFFALGMFFGQRHRDVPVKRTLKGMLPWMLGAVVLYVFVFFCLGLIKESSQVKFLAASSAKFFQFQHWGFRLLIGGVMTPIVLSFLPFSVPQKTVLSPLYSLSYKIYLLHQFILLGVLSLPTSVLSFLYSLSPILFPWVLFLLVLASAVGLSLSLSKIPFVKRIL